MNREQTEDLKAFEQRVIDCVSHVRRRSIKWRVLVAVVLLWVVVSMWSWWTDGSEHDNYLDMFYSNKSLCLSITVFFFVYILGFFDRQNAANIITNRCRSVLHDFNMSCNDQGKLIILKRTKMLSPDPWKHS
ncbi:Nuclear envelope phosphatase-regulatory subunit 1 [Geodia barretti]|uniref:Transmembrane protein 188 n=1 Tax=Geodia barretti TaxID=519541 RepID=A0AA35SNU7_GEOBA|nr:Nuclear envelope phosphatase-regulatory subunit 1 [Geodia barretti]